MNKNDLKYSINNFFSKLDSYNTFLYEKSISECIQDKNELNFEIINSKLAKIEAELKKSSSPFIVELAVSLIFGPMLGHIVEFGLKRAFAVVINNRKITVELFQSIEKQSLKGGSKGLKEIKNIVDNTDAAKAFPELNKIFNKEYEKGLSKAQVAYKRKKDLSNYASKNLEKLMPSILSQELYEYLSPGFFNDLIATAAPAIKKYTEDTTDTTEDKKTFADNTSKIKLLAIVNNYAFKVRTQNAIHEGRMIKFIDEFELPETLIVFLNNLYELSANQIIENSLTLERDRNDVKFLFMAVIFISTYGPPKKWLQVTDDNGNLLYEVTNKLENSVYKEYYKLTVKKNIDVEVYKFLLHELRGHKILDGKSFYEFYSNYKKKAFLNQGYHVSIDAKESYRKRDFPTPIVPDDKLRINDPRSRSYDAEEYSFFEMTRFLDENIYQKMIKGDTSIESLLSKYKSLLPK